MGRSRNSARARTASVFGLSLLLFALSPSSAPAVSAGPAGDFNGDGRSDLAIGVPQADDGTATGAGAVSVVPGTAAGPDATARLTVNQSSSGVPGASETGDGFGSATAWGDIDGDGHADLALASPGEDLGGHADAGGITLLYGSAAGLTPDSSMYARPVSSRLTGDRCGEALTVGDFNADGSADVFVFCPGSWSLWWIDGATRTVRSAAPQSTAEGFGSQSVTSLANSHAASGDVNADGYADALVTFTRPDGSSPLIVLPGSADGISTGTPVTLDDAGGVSVAAGDIDGDGASDVAVGRPHLAGGGAVTAYYGSPSGLAVADSTTVEQDTTGVPGAGEAGDELGASVAVGDADQDGYADVLAGLPGEDLTLDATARADAGAVLLLPGSAAGLTGSGSDTYYASKYGIPGAAEAGDRLGTAASLADLRGDGHADPGAGSDGENGGDGTVLVMNSGTGGVDPASSDYLGPGDLGVPPSSRIGDVLAP